MPDLEMCISFDDSDGKWHGVAHNDGDVAANNPLFVCSHTSYAVVVDKLIEFLREHIGTVE